MADDDQRFMPYEPIHMSERVRNYLAAHRYRKQRQSIGAWFTEQAEHANRTPSNRETDPCD